MTHVIIIDAFKIFIHHVALHVSHRKDFEVQLVCDDIAHVFD